MLHGALQLSVKFYVMLLFSENKGSLAVLIENEIFEVSRNTSANPVIPY